MNPEDTKPAKRLWQKTNVAMAFTLSVVGQFTAVYVLFMRGDGGVLLISVRRFGRRW